MKKNLKKLNALGKIIDLSMFYAITIYTESIILQGTPVDVSVYDLVKAGFCELEKSDIECYDYRKDNISVAIL